LSRPSRVFYPIVKFSVQSEGVDSVAYTQPSDRSAPHQTVPENIETAANHETRARTVLQAAFRDLHGSRLHGFALLVALGDRQLASAAASNALAHATSRLSELRHPERAAAWLRRRVVEELATSGRGQMPETERRAVLNGLGISRPTFDGLAAMSRLERAALVAATVERLDPMDVERVLDRSPADARAILERAHGRYLAAAAAGLAAETSTLPSDPNAPGQLAARVEAVASRTMGSGWSSR
jgi:hypothetical protein